MVKYRSGAVIEWFGRAWGINRRTNSELQTECPKCGHKSFYFNYKKNIGRCHSARCHYTPRLEDLIDRAGYSPDEWGGYRGLEREETAPVEVVLPGNRLLYYQGKEKMTWDAGALEYVRNRGISDADIIRFRFTSDGYRVYVPINKDGELFNYVGRDLTGQAEMKYLYCPGVKTSHTIFGWDECKLWDRLTLVENTFVSIWLRNSVQCSTNFGSSLSDEQLGMLKRSKIKSVALLWDEGAEKPAHKAVQMLSEVGIPACFVYMRGQPDDHGKEEICEIAEETHRLARKFVQSYDPFGRTAL